MSDWLLLLTVLVFSMVLTGMIRGLTLRSGLLDVPNHRSSHTIPTPRGGGLAFVVAFLLRTIYLLISGAFGPNRFTLVLVFSSLMVAGIGFWDDLRPLPARYRFAVQLIASAILVWAGRRAMGPIADLSLASFPIWFSTVFLVLAVVWGVNLFNFMDGIDGLAASEGIFVAGGAALLISIRSVTAGVMPLLCLAASCLGFLFWNWPPARIFMGDVGSGFLGLVLAGMVLRTSIYSSSIPIYCWLILAGIFLTDATITLLIRVFSGERWYAAHRSHAYQHAVVRYRSHLAVTVGVLAINIFWLLPLSYLCVILPRFGGIITIVAYLPLLALTLKFKAGQDIRS